MVGRWFPLTGLAAGQLTGLPSDADEFKHLSTYSLVSCPNWYFAEQVGEATSGHWWSANERINEITNNRTLPQTISQPLSAR